MLFETAFECFPRSSTAVLSTGFRWVQIHSSWGLKPQHSFSRQKRLRKYTKKKPSPVLMGLRTKLMNWDSPSEFQASFVSCSGFTPDCMVFEPMVLQSWRLRKFGFIFHERAIWQQIRGHNGRVCTFCKVCASMCLVVGLPCYIKWRLDFFFTITGVFRCITNNWIIAKQF